MRKTFTIIFSAMTLVTFGCSTIGSGKKVNQEWFQAVKKGNIKEVKEKVNEGVPIDQKDEKGMTALMYASMYGHSDIVWLLRRRGANVYEPLDQNTKNNNKRQLRGWTSLFIASQFGHAETAELLIKADSVGFRGAYDYTPLMVASANGNNEVIKMLLKYNVSVNGTNETGQTPLILASKRGHLETAKLLLKNGANIDTKDEDQNTAVDYARKNGHENLVKFLKDKIAKKKEKNLKKVVSHEYDKFDDKTTIEVSFLAEEKIEKAGIGLISQITFQTEFKGKGISSEEDLDITIIFVTLNKSLKYRGQDKREELKMWAHNPKNDREPLRNSIRAVSYDRDATRFKAKLIYTETFKFAPFKKELLENLLGKKKMDFKFLDKEMKFGKFTPISKTLLKKELSDWSDRARFYQFGRVIRKPKVDIPVKLALKSFLEHLSRIND